MKSSILTIAIIALLSVQAGATQVIHLEGFTPVGGFLGTIRGIGATIEALIIEKTKEVCKDETRVRFQDLNISIYSSGGHLNLEGPQDDLSAIKAAVSMSQPHANYTVDVLCD